MLPLLKSAVFIAAATGSAAPSLSDLKRARTKKPSDAYRGADQTKMSQTLNMHLRRSEAKVRACEDWSPKELQEVMHTMVNHRSKDLQGIYNTTNDRRQLTFASASEYLAHWADINHVADSRPHLVVPQRESHCREAVMWWVHHLDEEQRAQLRKQSVAVPLLPEGPKSPCGQDGSDDEVRVCAGIEKPNSCDWCHSTQAKHDAGVPGTSVPNALNFTNGPDDGNPHHWDRIRRCDQDQMPRCQLCEGIGGRAFHDNNSAINMTPCEIVATPDQVNMSTVAPPLYPKQFTVRRKDGKMGGYFDTLIGWDVDDGACFSFFPQNDSIGPLCYRDETAIVKYYDISKEAARTDYTLGTSLQPGLGNTTSSIIEVGWQMWVVNKIGGVVDQCVCTNPSGQHCTNKPCYSYLWHWDTFKTAQYLGREKIGVEWIKDHGVGNSSYMMELDHFIMWSHHVWTDPVSRRLVRAWKSFNGLQVYDPDAWEDKIEDPSIFDVPPAICKKPTDPTAEVWRIHCGDDGNYNGTAAPPGEAARLMKQQMSEILHRLKASQEAFVV